MEITDTTLKSESAIALSTAQKLMVRTDADYQAAGNARKEIKQTLKNIAAYWAPKKEQAFQLHKSLVAAEKEMTTPLEQADKMIDQRMGEYRREIERQRIEAEREQRRLEEAARRLEEEARRLAEEAAQKEELDDADVEILQIAQAELEQAAYVAEMAPVAPAAAKMQGITVRKVWRARVVNDLLVPVSVAGIIIRPIDLSAINRLAVASSGGFKCPGIEFYQEELTSVRL